MKGTLSNCLILALILLCTPLAAQNRGEARIDQALTGYLDEALPKSITQVWTYKTGDEIKASPVIAGNRIIVGCMDGSVYSLSAEGKLLWKTGTGNGIEAAPLVLGNTVYIGNLTGELFAFDLATGKEKWKYSAEGQISGQVNWWKQGQQTRLLVGSYDYYLHCIDAATGKGLWKYESDNFINGAASCVGGKVMFGGCDGFLHIVDIPTGKQINKINVATYVPGSAPSDGKFVFLGDYDGGFSCVDLKQGKVAWKYVNDKSQLPFLASAAITGDRAVTGNRDRHVYCFSKADGKLVWKTNTGEKVDASPLICRDKVLVANMRGDLLLLNLSDGSVVWTIETGSPVFGNPAVSDGRIVVCGSDGAVRMYAGRK